MVVVTDGNDAGVTTNALHVLRKRVAMIARETLMRRLLLDESIVLDVFCSCFGGFLLGDSDGGAVVR